jgi:tetratricopeptide (TPR) repeat protein
MATNKQEAVSTAAVAVGNTTENISNQGSNALGSIKQWFTNNSKKVILYGGIIIAALAAYIAYKKFYKEPAELKAQDVLAVAHYYYAKDSFALALNGDTKNPGFAKITKSHSGTAAGNLANFYAGVCTMKVSSDSVVDKAAFEGAIKYFKNFEPKGATQFAAYKFLNLGDCYSSIGNNDEAIKNYEECGSIGDAAVSSKGFLKAALLSENTGNSKKAGEFYKELYTRFPASSDAAAALKGAAKNGVLLDK